MNGLRIRSETPPARCEICHQADRFDPATGLCLRCREIDLPRLNSTNSSRKGIPSTDLRMVVGVGVVCLFHTWLTIWVLGAFPINWFMVVYFWSSWVGLFLKWRQGRKTGKEPPLDMLAVAVGMSLAYPFLIAGLGWLSGIVFVPVVLYGWYIWFTQHREYRKETSS